MDESSANARLNIIATTRVVHQMVLTVESLHDNAATLNSSSRKPVITAEHDKLCPPMGQIISGKVVPLEDGHFGLAAEFDTFAAPTTVALPSGDIGFQQESTTNHFPFATAQFHTPDTFCVGIDPTGLGGAQEAHDFFADLHAAHSTEFGTQPIGRRSLLPDPLVVFTLGTQVSAAWLGVRIAKAAADAIEPELKKFFAAMIDTIKRMVVNAIPANRPVTYVLEVHGTPNLEFVARTRDAHAVISAMADSDLTELRPQIDALRDKFGAEFIQFRMQDDATWHFNYLLTEDGKVIGTKESFDYRAVVLKEMEREWQR
ncbi:MAG: hypothetical protein HQ582_30540 [Planctomycetes bacterium]|nr:hypothetical protein [Planctomycetota bacterium]